MQAFFLAFNHLSQKHSSSQIFYLWLDGSKWTVVYPFVHLFGYGSVQVCWTECNKFAFSPSDLNRARCKQTHVHLHLATHKDYMGLYFFHHKMEKKKSLYEHYCNICNIPFRSDLT